MDNHPIPQDVTNFQFRFVGNMTIKQFGYIAAGVILAWIFLAAPLPFLLRILLAGLCVMAGVILSFVPIEGRPADVMAMRFIRALFSPTQFTYQKTPVVQQAQPSAQQIQTPTPQPVKEPEKKDKEELVKVETLTPVATAAVQQQTTPQPPQPAPSPVVVPAQETKPVQDQQLKQQVAVLSEELAEAKTQESNEAQGTQQATIAHEKVVDLEKELQEVMTQKQNLEKQLLDLQKSLSEKKQQVFTPTTAEAPQETQSVKKIPKQLTKAVGTPLVPDVPNLVTGVIKDSRGNVLPNMLIEVKDKDGNPVRAFKTNQLGQFASATPLVNGMYTISFEDPAGKHTFDSVELQATGDVIMPLEIISIDAREKLRQELFG